MRNLVGALTLIILVLFFTGCAKREPAGLISGEDEWILGNHLDSIYTTDILKNKILDTPQYSYSYGYMDTLMRAVLRSKHLVRLSSDYTVRLVNDNSVNVTVFPGGFYYLNTGLIKKLDNGAQLAGILAHEIAHDDLRHITSLIENKFGIDFLLDIVLFGRKEKTSDILDFYTENDHPYSFSRKEEIDANEKAIEYLTDTQYDPLSLYDGLSKINASPVHDSAAHFKKNHPLDETVFEEIMNSWSENDSIEGDLFLSSYRAFKNSLP